MAELDADGDQMETDKANASVLSQTRNREEGGRFVTK